MNASIEGLHYLQDVGTGNITLIDDLLVNAERVNLEFLLGASRGYEPRQILDPYRFLAHFYTTAGLERPEAAKVYEDTWERSTDNNFRGHMFGHYMSALAMSYRGIKDEALKKQIKERLSICVTELKKCQDAFAEMHLDRAGYIGPFGDVRLDEIDGLTGGVGQPIEGTVFVPWYNLHKVFAGLLDIYNHLDDAFIKETALEIAKGFADYFYNVRVSRYTAEHKEKMLQTEYGSMNTALYELYRLTGISRYRVCAETFDEVSLFEKLAKGENVLPGRHANTHIPKFIGALKRYMVLTEDEGYYDALTPEAQKELPKYLQAAENFFQIVVDHHSYITGGNSSDEHFQEPDTLSSSINRDATHETCNVHNMLKLTRELFKITKDKKYADFYENAFINAILSAQHPETGEMMYFQPMGSGYYKLFRHGLFWCCTGTGIENYVKLGDSIYFKDESSIYVNLYFSSTYTDTEKNIRLTQSADILEGNRVELKVASLDAKDVKEGLSLHLRNPFWNKKEAVITVNGKQVHGVDQKGYYVLENVANGDLIALTFSKEVEVDALKDNPHVMAFRYGPVVLSAGLGADDLDAANPNGIMVLVARRDMNAPDTVSILDGKSVDEWKANLAENFTRLEAYREKIAFKLNGTEMDQQLVFTPHYKKYNERYALYLTFVDDQTREEIARKKEAETLALLAEKKASAYLSQFDNHAYEAEYNLQEHDTANGSWPWHGKMFRFGKSAESWFSYDLPIVPDTVNYLSSVLFREHAGRTWAIYINDELLDHETVTDAVDPEDIDANNASFYTSRRLIPEKYTNGDLMRMNEKGVPYITVRFASTGGPLGGIFGISVTQEK